MGQGLEERAKEAAKGGSCLTGQLGSCLIWQFYRGETAERRAVHPVHDNAAQRACGSCETMGHAHCGGKHRHGLRKRYTPAIGSVTLLYPSCVAPQWSAPARIDPRPPRGAGGGFEKTGVRPWLSDPHVAARAS